MKSTALLVCVLTLALVAAACGERRTMAEVDDSPASVPTNTAVDVTVPDTEAEPIVTDTASVVVDERDESTTARSDDDSPATTTTVAAPAVTTAPTTTTTPPTTTAPPTADAVAAAQDALAAAEALLAELEGDSDAIAGDLAADAAAQAQSD